MAYRLVRLCERAPVLRFNVSYEVEEWYWLGVVKALDTLGKGLIFSTPVIMVVGFGMLAYQGLFWLTHGIWKPITVFQVLQDVLPLNFSIGSSYSRPIGWEYGSSQASSCHVLPGGY